MLRTHLHIQATEKTSMMTRSAEQTAMMIRFWKVSSKWTWLSMMMMLSQVSMGELSVQVSSSSQGGLGGGGRENGGGAPSPSSWSR